jgi:hypothetical protein
VKNRRTTREGQDEERKDQEQQRERERERIVNVTGNDLRKEEGNIEKE